MISAGDFRNGITIEFEGNVYQIMEFQHVKPGKGAAFVRTKLKNIINAPRHELTEKICNIYTQMVTCLTLWIQRPMIRSHSMQMRLGMPSNS